MRLPENLRDELKKPLGILIADDDVTKEHVLQQMGSNRFLITVGDATTEKMILFGLIPSLQIVDSVEKRSKRDLPPGYFSTTLYCDNPAAEITPESVYEIKKSFTLSLPVRIIVHGEEDLLVLPVVLYAPQNSVVLYGQPNEGLVVVHVTEETRNKAKSIMNMMC